MTFRELFANSAMRPYLVRRARGLHQGPPSQVCLDRLMQIPDNNHDAHSALRQREQFTICVAYVFSP